MALLRTETLKNAQAVFVSFWEPHLRFPEVETTCVCVFVFLERFLTRQVHFQFVHLFCFQ